ncbi:MAG: hypothetical protein C0402_11165 [Thermodesulfovibrio sp.]|nr:hypothetical protein [Thermodesulfovibrio sp.]
MRERISKAGWVALFVILQMVTTVYAAAPPTYAKLAEFQLAATPAKIAADAAGAVYSTRASDNTVSSSTVFKYSLDGVLLGSISLASYPLSLHVGSNGILYVGQYGKIDKFSNGTLVGTISGVLSPAAMASKADGSLYILDKNDYKVKIADASGVVQPLFGSNGLFGGAVKDMAFDEANNELYLLDNGLSVMVGATATSVWRVQVFDLSGAPVRQFSFASTGATGGEGYSFSSIAVDDAQRVYLSDGTKGSVFVYDKAGTSLAKLGGIAGVDNIKYANSKLYASVPSSKKIYCLGIDQYAILDANPSALKIQVQGAYSTGDTSFGLANSGTAAVSWTAQASPDWVRVSALAGQTAAGATDTINVSAATADMQSGQYGGNISFTYDGRSLNLPVTLTLLPAPALSVTPATVDLQVEEGSVIQQSITVNLENDLSKAMTWTAATSSNWIALSNTTGISNAASTVTLSLGAGLAAGSYAGQVTIDSPATATSSVVTVNLTVTAKQVVVDPGVKRNALNIIVSRNAGQYETSDVTVFGGDGSKLLQFTPFSYRYGSNTATGDFDGDGIPDILVGTGGGNRVPAAVKGFNRDGSMKAGFAFAAYTHRTGVNVAAGDFDGDRKDEIVTADASKTTTVRILAYDASTATINDSGATFEAYASQTGGVTVAVGDVDGDGVAEIVTAPRTAGDGVTVKIFKVDTTAGFGSWAASSAKEFTACAKSAGVPIAGTDATAANLAVADLAGDGAAEIFVTCIGTNGPEVRIFTATGELVKTFATGSSTLDFIAAGDVNGDGNTDIVLGDGSGNNMKSVRILDSNGQRASGFDAFSSGVGVKVSVADLGLQGVK